jgi:hypothetical protein
VWGGFGEGQGGVEGYVKVTVGMMIMTMTMMMMMVTGDDG